MSASLPSGIAGVTVDRPSLTATVRYYPGEVRSPSELRRVAVAALRRTARAKVRVMASEHVGGPFVAGTQARTFQAVPRD